MASGCVSVPPGTVPVRAKRPHSDPCRVVKDHGYLPDNLYSERLSDLRHGVNDDGPRSWKTAYDLTALLCSNFEAEADSRRSVSITLKTSSPGEQTAQTCALVFTSLEKPRVELSIRTRSRDDRQRDPLPRLHVLSLLASQELCPNHVSWPRPVRLWSAPRAHHPRKNCWS